MFVMSWNRWLQNHNWMTNFRLVWCFFWKIFKNFHTLMTRRLQLLFDMFYFYFYLSLIARNNYQLKIFRRWLYEGWQRTELKTRALLSHRSSSRGNSEKENEHHEQCNQYMLRDIRLSQRGKRAKNASNISLMLLWTVETVGNPYKCSASWWVLSIE